MGNLRIHERAALQGFPSTIGRVDVAERVGRCKGIVNNLSLLGVLTVPLVVTFATINVFQFFAKADMGRVLGPVAFVLLLSCLIVVSVFSFHNTAAETLIQCFC